MAPQQGLAEHPGSIWHPSPNHGPRRAGLTPRLIVIHYTAMASAQDALDRLCDPVDEVSAHYLIGATGTVWQMVSEAQRAWHAGAGCWGGQDDINSRSIGIELDNRGDHPFSAPQMQALEDLLRGIMARWQIPASGVIGHADMAPGRKFDPGPHFDWARLARVGLSVWPDAEPGQATDPTCWQDYAAAFGYPVLAAAAPDISPADAAFAAFRARFRPWATDMAPDAEDLRIAERLANGETA